MYAMFAESIRTVRPAGVRCSGWPACFIDALDCTSQTARELLVG